MNLNTDGSKTIYQQLAEWLEAEILNGNLIEEERIYSQYQLADMYNINPATAAKALSILADEKIIYKKRGMGMFVSTNAKQLVYDKRKELSLQKLVDELTLEAKRLGMNENELVLLIKEKFSNS